MPHLHGITVHVTDSHGNNVQEWGVQYLRQHTEGERVSAYIQSTTDVSFEISLQPDIPFIEHLSPSDALGGEKVSARRETGHSKPSSEDRSTKYNHETISRNTSSSPVRPSAPPQSHTAPEFAFLASLYLDGRRIPERKIIVYTNPADKDFNSPDGKVVFKHRWVQSADGRMTEHAWVFKEKAIETVFDRLMIAGSQANVDAQDDDTLVKAMETSGFDTPGKMATESKVGQIVVELRRVILGEKRTETNYRAHHQAGQDEEIDVGVARDITHATGFIHKNIREFQPLRVVDYQPYKPNEGLYVTFQFFYRSREQLQLFHFPGFPPLPTTTTARTSRLLNARMADLTPLSISLPLNQKVQKRQPDKNSYDAKLNEHGSKLNKCHKYDFGSGYRDPRAMPPSPRNEIYESKLPARYPAAPLPFLAKRPFENTQSNPVPSKNDPTTAESPFLAGKFTASTLEYRPQSQRHARGSFSPDDPLFITTEPSSSAPSSINFTKQQMANVTDKDGYRGTAEDSCPSDEEEDADNEPATRSDLETHADDDVLDSFADPEELREGYDTLQYQSQDLRIRKRQRDSFEHAEDGNGTWQEVDAAHLDFSGKQKPQKLLLTEEDRARRGKKSRTTKKPSAAVDDQGTHGIEKTRGVGVA